jgi:hypothetical protein
LALNVKQFGRPLLEAKNTDIENCDILSHENELPVEIVFGAFNVAQGVGFRGCRRADLREAELEGKFVVPPNLEVRIVAVPDNPALNPSTSETTSKSVK